MQWWFAGVARVGATARAARGRRAGNRLPSRRHTTTVDTDGYDISEVRGHLRFILSFVLPNFALPSFDVPPSTLPFISIRFFCRSCSLIISFCSSPAHVTLSLSLPPPAPSMPRASILFFPLEPGLSGPSAEGRLLFPPRSCFYFPSAFLPPLFRPRLLFHLLFSRHPPN